mmetsp:Transcript_30081/g.64990  ORF Transcript_30081/g.64990 Transcript_30081/m.64990 type:complete len:216 (+) Transcript_30081:537-1184(+)
MVMRGLCSIASSDSSSGVSSTFGTAACVVSNIVARILLSEGLKEPKLRQRPASCSSDSSPKCGKSASKAAPAKISPPQAPLRVRANPSMVSSNSAGVKFSRPSSSIRSETGPLVMAASATAAGPRQKPATARAQSNEDSLEDSSNRRRRRTSCNFPVARPAFAAPKAASATALPERRCASYSRFVINSVQTSSWSNFPEAKQSANVASSSGFSRP